MECSEANVKKIKKCLSGIIEKEESILEYATVKLSICSPQTEKQFKPFIKEGILCVIINRNTSCLYLQLFELLEFHKVFEIELYTNISDGYTVSDNYFHVIEFPGFFLGLSFPKIDYPNVANRSSLIQKSIISISKFISINLSDYIYSHKFDADKESSKKYNKKKFKSQIIKEDKKKFVKINDIPKNDSESNSNSNMDLLSNKLKFNANENGKIEINEDNKNSNNEFNSIKKFKSQNFLSLNNNINNQTDSGSGSNSNSNDSRSNNNSIDENDSISVTSKNNRESSIFNQERSSAYVSSKDKKIKGILKNSISSQVISNEEKVNNNINNNEKEKPKILIESKEKNLFDSITIENSNDKKIYKIVQFHILKDKMKLVKKMFRKNFDRFIDPKKISFEKIKEYKINTYDFFEEDFSSEEGEGQKTFVDYVPSNFGLDMFGYVENNVDNQDKRLAELEKQRNNLKEISQKRKVNLKKTEAIEN